MLRTIGQSSYPFGAMMSVDFGSYLLSSSPPANSFELLNYSFSQNSSCWSPDQNGWVNQQEDTPLETVKKNGPLKPIIIRNNSVSDDSGRESSSEPPTPTPPSSPCRLKKRVSFADHNGRALATVRILTEPLDMPPQLCSEVLLSLTQGVSAGVMEQPPLKLAFTQPASDYLVFRDRIDKDCVSLENVILRDYAVLGTVKVKNISFEKSVFLRYTFNSWEDHMDVTTNYVSGPNDVFDTFSFEFEVPTTLDQSQKLEFAVCYETKGMQYWDNNYGENYGILPVDFRSRKSSDSITALTDPNTSSLWTEYRCWNKVNTATPYW